MTRLAHVGIAGAGLAGLTAALALQRHGLRVTVLEQAPQLGEVGAGLQLSANATRVLSYLGLQDAVGRVASEAAGKEIRLWSTGQRWPLFDLGTESVRQYGHPYLMLYRPDLHRVLADAVGAADPGAIRLGARCVAAAADGTGAEVTLDGGERLAFDMLVGADGVHSTVRRALFGPDAPRFSGCVAWRGVIRADRLPMHLRTPVGVNWVGPGRHVVHYPLRGGELVNFVGVVEQQGWTQESWTTPGERADCHADFEGWHEDVHMLVAAIERPYKWALMVRDPMPSWVRGSAVLIGDACHPTLPFLAQGAAMAIEDGYLLARVIEVHGATGQALRRFEQLRLDRTSRIVLGSAANAARFHNPELAHAEGAATYVAHQWREDVVRERYEWLFRYDAAAVDVGPEAA